MFMKDLQDFGQLCWGEEFRHARAVAKRFRRFGIKTSKQNNFQILLRKI